MVCYSHIWKFIFFEWVKIKKHYIEKLKQYDFPTVEGVLQSVEGDHKIFLSLLNDMKIMDQKRQIKFLDLWPEFEEYCCFLLLKYLVGSQVYLLFGGGDS